MPLINAKSQINENLSPSSYLSINVFKKNLKKELLLTQHNHNGDPDDWQTDNFVKISIKGHHESHSQR